MPTVIHHTVCPVCGSGAFKKILTVKDHTVSGELFDVYECLNCTLRFTQDAPMAASRMNYYKSENYISHSNTSKGLINRLYQLIRKKTIVAKRKLIEKSCGLRNGVLLDVGSGTGSFAAIMKKHGWDVTGLEPDADARNLAKKENNLELLDIAALHDFPHQSFDAITLWHVLEHVEDLTSFLKLLANLMKADGRVFIAVPNYTSHDARVYKNFWAAYDVPRHLYHFSPQSMKHMVEMNGLKIEKYKPMWFDSFYISLLSSSYKNAPQSGGMGRTSWISALWNGKLSNLYALMNVKKCSSVIYILRK
jgi:2-polyprenyl-3-methyl-5-hydroxy-6-metoxy-1,4-benzoquinol methylase